MQRGETDFGRECKKASIREIRRNCFLFFVILLHFYYKSSLIIVGVITILNKDKLPQHQFHFPYIQGVCTL